MLSVESNEYPPQPELRAGESAQPPVVRFTWPDITAANEEWGFNCGPAALCAVLGLRPEEARPHLGEFEHKGYTNPTLMYEALRSLGVRYSSTIDATGGRRIAFPGFGLARIQWAGPWTRPGVPMQARYRQTHWVGVWTGPLGMVAVFDVNVGHWGRREDWSRFAVPDILRNCVPKASGEWWVTHALEIDRACLASLRHEAAT